MPLSLDALKKDTLDPDRYVISWEGFSSPAGTAVRGQRFRASHPIVRSAPANFVEDGVPEEEWPSYLDRAFREEKERVQAVADEREARFQEAAKANRVRLEAPQMFRLKRDVVTTVDHMPATVTKGSVVLEDDRLRVEHPDLFELA